MHRSISSTAFLQFDPKRQYHCGMFLSHVSFLAKLYFSELVDSTYCSFTSVQVTVLSFFLCINWTSNAHKYCEERLTLSLLNMTLLARSLLEQSGFFLRSLAKAEWYLNIPQKMKSSLCLHTSFVIILYYKSHVLLWSKMYKAFVNTIFVHIFWKMEVELCHNNFFLHICEVIFFEIWWLHCTLNLHLSFWTPCHGQKGPIELGMSFRPSFPAVFLELDH